MQLRQPCKISCTKELPEVDHAKTSDKICVLAPAPFDATSVHTDILIDSCHKENWSMFARMLAMIVVACSHSCRVRTLIGHDFISNPDPPPLPHFQAWYQARWTWAIDKNDAKSDTKQTIEITFAISRLLKHVPSIKKVSHCPKCGFQYEVSAICKIRANSSLNEYWGQPGVTN